LIKNEDEKILAYLLSIYDKSEFENLPEHEIEKMVLNIQSEFGIDSTNQKDYSEQPENEEDSH